MVRENVHLPIRLCCRRTETAQLIVDSIADDYVVVTFIQSTNVNDNTYGANTMAGP